MKKAVMYGAGNIGRGFIGKIFSESGYKVCFIDVDPAIVAKLNDDNEYPVRIVTNNDQWEETVSNVYAVSGLDFERISEEIASADIVATAVGVNVLPKIVAPMSAGLKKRFDEGGAPLNIIICENLIDANKYFRSLIENELGDDYKKVLSAKLGLVEASIGRMVPTMTNEMKEGNILRIWVEPYNKLPVDRSAFIGDIPKLKGIIPYSPFDFYIKRKLFVHNMGHAMCAFLGWRKKYKYIYESIADLEIKTYVRAAMMETINALSIEYGTPVDELVVHVDDLLHRFENRSLGDTVARVGKDPLRKLGSNDRFIGAMKYCIQMGIKPLYVIKGIAAGLQYDNAEDEWAVVMQEKIHQEGIDGFLLHHCDIADVNLRNIIVKEYQE